MLAYIKISDIVTSSILVYYIKHKVLLSLMYIKNCIKPSKCIIPEFDGNFTILCTEKPKSTLVDKI